MKKRKVTYYVPRKQFDELRDAEQHVCTLPLTMKNIAPLPCAYEDCTGTVLVFPKKKCPKRITFRPKGIAGIWTSCTREVVNIMGYKQEGGSEVIKIRMK